ncbi:S8 family serine peptidase [Micromonospora sp. MW-13]|uniref:S8 family serine peptidase n=1 Tax=Micromonospora sp. MW-13 TaxID=2094022 RepID=UPI001405252A|nr:S8 family serine peptidase [Micromonospora sp. MW-13]
MSTIVTMLAALGLSSSLVTTPAQAAPVQPALMSQLAADGTATFWVYLRERADLGAASRIADRAEQGRQVHKKLIDTAAASQAGLVRMLDAEGVAHREFWIANTIKVTGNADLVRRVAARPEVEQITADEKYELPVVEVAEQQALLAGIEWNISRVNAPRVWQDFGVTGEDIVIGSIDTGVLYTHPAVTRQYRGNLGNGRFDHNYNWWDPSNVCGAPSLIPCDNNSHGTHTVGTMVGDDGAGNRIGVAPGAKWIAAKGCEERSCSQEALLASGQFMLAPTDLRGRNADPARRPHIVNNSWGGSATISPWYRPTVRAWVAAGIFPQFSSGNPGAACGAAGNPGNLPESYAAGAFDAAGRLYSNSGRGPSAWGADMVKPNITAPGVAVRSSLNNGSYGPLTGTSMASPHVAAAVALLWSATPSLERDIDATRAILDGSALDTEDLTCGGTKENNNVWGQGRLDTFAAVSRSPVPAKGQLTGTVLGAGNAPVAGATITITGALTRTRSTGSNGGYAITLPAGEYTVTASAFGYQPSSAKVTITGGGATTQGFTLVAPDGRGLDVSPFELDFGVTKVGETGGPLTVTLTGTGSTPVTITEITDPGNGFARSGGTCGALPISLAHLANCTLTYTFTPSVPGQATATVSVAGDAPGSPHSVALVSTAIRIPVRTAALTLASGEDTLFSGVMDPLGRYAYFGTQTKPGRVIKVDLATSRRVGAITLEAGENFVNSAIIDREGRYAYFGTGTAPGKVVKVDLHSFERVSVISLGQGENFLRTAVIDPAGRYAYFGTSGTPGRVVKLDLRTFARIGVATLEGGAGNLRSAVIDPAGRFAYFGTDTKPGQVVKLDLTTFQQAGALSMVNESAFLSAVIDPLGRFAYFATATSPARVVKVDLESFTRAEAIDLAADENMVLSAVIDSMGESAYFGTGTSPGRIVKVDLATFSRVGAATLEAGENSLLSMVLDPQSAFVYAGTLGSPGRLVKVQVDGAIQLTVEGRRSVGSPEAVMSWEGAMSANVDVFRDGELGATLANDGGHIEVLPPWAGNTHTYQVCQAGSRKCSNLVTVRFGGN